MEGETMDEEDDDVVTGGLIPSVTFRLQCVEKLEDEVSALKARLAVLEETVRNLTRIKE
jgi:hypothetical protein